MKAIMVITMCTAQKYLRRNELLKNKYTSIRDKNK